MKTKHVTSILIPPQLLKSILVLDPKIKNKPSKSQCIVKIVVDSENSRINLLSPIYLFFLKIFILLK